MTRQQTLGLICLSGFLAVAIGAFGAHGVSDPKAKAWIVTGSSQHMAHTLAMFAAIWLQDQGYRRAKQAILLFGVGICLFAGSLYALALGATRVIAMAAPMGGLSLLAGWLVLAFACVSHKDTTDA